MKKTVLILILVLIAVGLGVTGYFVFSDMAQERSLDRELAQISQLTASTPIDTQQVHSRLSRTVTKGDYAVVEQAIKAYLKDGFDNIERIAQILGDEKITSLLTAQNYIEDGKDFVNSLNYIDSTISELRQRADDYQTFLTGERASSYIEGKDLDEYYVELYMSKFASDPQQAEDQTVQDAIEEVISILSTSKEILQLLASNQNSWYVEEQTLVFSDEELSDRYNELIAEL